MGKPFPTGNELLVWYLWMKMDCDPNYRPGPTMLKAWLDEVVKQGMTAIHSQLYRNCPEFAEEFSPPNPFLPH